MNRRMLVVSDIHSNLEAFEAVLADAENHGSYTDRLCAGDVVGYGPDPNAVIERVRSEGFITVLGNHDRGVRGVYQDSRKWVPSGRTYGEYQSSHYEKVLNLLLGENPGIKDFNRDAVAAAIQNALALTPENLEFLNRLSNAPYIDPSKAFAMVHGSFAGVIENPGEWEHLVEDIYIMDSVYAFDAMDSLVLVDGKLDRKATILDPEQTPNKPKSKISRFASYREGAVNIPIGIVGHSHKPVFSMCVFPSANITGVYKGKPNPYFSGGRIVEDFQFGEDQEGRAIEEEIDFKKLPENVSGERPSWFKTGYEGYEDFDSMLQGLFSRRVLVNPGSVGQPRNGHTQARYLIIDFGEEGKVKFDFRKVTYDVEATQKKLRERCYPKSTALRLETGK